MFARAAKAEADEGEEEFDAAAGTGTEEREVVEEDSKAGMSRLGFILSNLCCGWRNWKSCRGA